VELIQVYRTGKPEVQVYRTNVLTAVPICSARLPKMTENKGLLRVVSKAEVPENFQYESGDRPTYDNVVPIDSKVSGFFTMQAFGASMANGGKYQRLQGETEAVAHTNELMVNMSLTTVSVAM
jgi:hypothetical protein